MNSIQSSSACSAKPAGGAAEALAMLTTDGMGTPTRRFIPLRHARFPMANGSIFLDRYNIKEYRTCWRHGVDTRDHHYDVYLTYNYPGSEDIETIIRHCAIGCGIATVIAAIIAGGTTASAAINAFVACVSACVQSQVSNSFSCDIDVVDAGSDDWSGH